MSVAPGFPIFRVGRGEPILEPVDPLLEASDRHG